MPAEDHVGLQGPEFTMDIERGKLREFARSMNAPLPEFVDGEHPLIPATFLITAAYGWGYSLERPRGTVFERIDHDFSVPLHAEESFAFHGPLPRAGDRLRCRASLEKVWRKQGGRGGELTFLVMLTEFRNRAGELVAEQRSTTVTTANAPDSGGWNVDIPEYRPAYAEDLDPGDPFAAIARREWEDVETGAAQRVETGALHVGDIVRFQGVVGEDNPLHYDLAWARLLGYPNVFGLGSHQASQLAALAAHWFDPAAVIGFRARFRNVYWPGESLTCGGRVTGKYRDPRSGHRMLELELGCTRNDDEAVVDVWMTLDFDRPRG